MLSREDLANYLNILKLQDTDLTTLELKQVSQAFQKLALLSHPDKAGEEFTAEFQTLRNAYEKVREHLLASSEASSSFASNFFDANFEQFNFPYENQGSFTVKIEDTLVTAWNESLTNILGSPEIKKNIRGTETDRYWKVNFFYVSNVEITIHLYMKPKTKKGCKLLIQGGHQPAICI